MAADRQELYGLALEEFIPGRQALAKVLRQEGRREQAKEVAALRKPSAAAWAVNQLVRTQRRDVEALFAAGDTLVAAQTALVAGKGDAGALREAQVHERDAVAALTQTARGLLSGDGHSLSSATLERVSQTLEAAAVDEAARAQVRDGCLERELHHVGIGAVTAALSLAPAPPSRRARDRPDAEAAHTVRAQRAAELATARQAELATARQAEAAARRAAGQADRALAAAQRRRDEAAAALEQAERELDGARERAQTATLTHRRAKQALEGP